MGVNPRQVVTASESGRGGWTPVPRTRVADDHVAETLWVTLYVMLGKVFSDRVQGLAGVLGDLSWVLVGVCVAAFLGWNVWRYVRAAPTAAEARVEALRYLLHAERAPTRRRSCS